MSRYFIFTADKWPLQFTTDHGASIKEPNEIDRAFFGS